jgi:dTDP-4-amino-4,6-dideoxygalactose transaminase
MRYGNGPIKEYSIISEGFKGSMNDISAAIGIEQIHRWPEMSRRRDEIWAVYEQAFGSKPKAHSHHIYAIQVDKRDAFRRMLHERGVGTGIHYKPLHLEPAFAKLGHFAGEFEVAERIGARTLSLPLSSKMTVEEAHFVVQAVNEVKGELNA